MALRFIETDIEIDAPATEVWRTLSDLSTWSEWHPFVERATGEVVAGTKVTLHKSAPGARTIAVGQKVIAVDEGTEFRLGGKIGWKGLLDNEHRFRVEAVDERRTRFLHGQAFRGLLVRLIIRRRGESTYEIFEQINLALKAHMEGHRPPPAP